MKLKTVFLILLIALSILLSIPALCQEHTSQDSTIYMITKNDGTKFIGQIISQDEREVLIETTSIGRVFIPRHEIRRIEEVKKNKYNNSGVYIGDNIFATRYFITTNGFPLKRGESYIQWNLHGPDFQFGIGKNFSVGAMTSWIGIPVIATFKYAYEANDYLSFAVGFLGGSGTYYKPDLGVMLPFVTKTYGNRKNNISFSGGYAGVYSKQGSYTYTILNSPEQWTSFINSYDYEIVESMEFDGRIMLSVAAMLRLSDKVSFVFDSFFVLKSTSKTREQLGSRNIVIDGQTYNQYYIFEERIPGPSIKLFLPGIRWQTDENRAFQFGFSGFYFDDEVIPYPFIQWYRKL